MVVEIDMKLIRYFLFNLLLLQMNSVHSFYFKKAFASRSNLGVLMLNADRTSSSRRFAEDQQKAQAVRSAHEKKLFDGREVKLQTPIFTSVSKPPRGTGFSSVSNEIFGPKAMLGKDQAKIVHRDGVIRVNNAITAKLAAELRAYCLSEYEQSLKIVLDDSKVVAQRFGFEVERICRQEVLHSLLPPDNYKTNGHPEIEVLRHLLGENGVIRPLYEELVTSEGMLFELSSMITFPGSLRQMV